MCRIRHRVALFAILVCCIAAASEIRADTLIDLNFNSGVDDNGVAQGDLSFSGAGIFKLLFTDDNSNGSSGGDADGVHINNINFGNIKVGSQTDFVLGAFNAMSGDNNLHSSGIVAMFNQGVESVSLFDTDNDATLKTLFAFDENGLLIGQTAAATQTTFLIDTSMTTGGILIHSVEFDTLPGTAGGSSDGTVFTIDDFRVEGTAIPEPISFGFLCLGSIGFIALRRR